MPRNYGKKAVVHYTGTLDDGSIFDSSRDRDPLVFLIGQGEVIPGFERTVADMEPSSKTTVTFTPEEAYGPRNEAAVQLVPLEVFGDDLPQSGELVSLVTPAGDQLNAIAIETVPTGVRVDFNHPLAGETLTFEIELIEIREAWESAPSEDAGTATPETESAEAEPAKAESAETESPEADAAETAAGKAEADEPKDSQA